MGNRQSAQQSSQQNQAAEGSSSSSSNNNNNERVTNSPPTFEGPVTRSQSAAMRPISRVEAQRTTLRSAVIPVNDNQRRDERRLRRERIRQTQQQQQELAQGRNAASAAEEARSLLATMSAAMAALGNISTTNTGIDNNNSTLPPISPFSRMIATAITEAVMSSFRPGGPMASIAANATTDASTTNTENTNTNTTTTGGGGGGGGGENRPEYTLHLPPELFRQMEPGSQEDTFMRFMRLPVLVSSTPTSATNITTTESQPTTHGPVNADGQAPTLSSANSEITRLLSVPLLLYGQRSDILTTTAPPQQPSTTTNTTTETSTNTATTEASSQNNNDTNSQNSTGQQQPSVAGGQWTLYIISGGSVEGIMNDNLSYEDLLELVTLLGPARRPTVSQEAIDHHVPIVKYSEQVKNTILGNAEKCQVCLNDYVLQEDLRVLGCHHGFHSSCIDTWLTGGQNKCPLCRDVPVPMDASSDDVNNTPQ